MKYKTSKKSSYGANHNDIMVFYCY